MILSPLLFGWFELGVDHPEYDVPGHDVLVIGCHYITDVYWPRRGYDWEYFPDGVTFWVSVRAHDIATHAACQLSDPLVIVFVFVLIVLGNICLATLAVYSDFAIVQRLNARLHFP